MLPKRNRLNKKEVKIVLKSFDQAISEGCFKYYVMKNNLNRSRFAVIISQKTIKKAVDRIHLKRKIYSDIERNFTWNLKENDYLVRCTSRPINKEYGIAETLNKIVGKYAEEKNNLKND